MLQSTETCKGLTFGYLLRHHFPLLTRHLRDALRKSSQLLYVHQDRGRPKQIKHLCWHAFLASLAAKLSTDFAAIPGLLFGLRLAVRDWLLAFARVGNP